MRKRSLRPMVIAAVLVLGGLAILAAAITLGGSSSARGVHMLAFTKGEPDAVAKPGNEQDAVGPESRTPDSAAAQDYANRAYPADTIPFQATLNSQSTFTELKKHGNKKNAGAWQLIGPDQAKYPALLDQFLAGGKPYVASGRVTALGIAQNCGQGKCRLYLAAAGGGVWVTDKALHSNPSQKWEFTSGGFLTNAIGSLLVDPSDPSGNTVYAGTGEGNASGDSEAGMGIYKTTDGGDTWALVPGSSLFRDRAVGTMALDGAGNLLVGISSSVRGIASVTGGQVGCPTPSGCAVRGIYRQTGATFTLLRATNIRGTNEVAVDPNNSNVLYQASFDEGVWRSKDNGVTWTQIKTPLFAGLTTDRAEFALAKLPGGLTRMYVGVGDRSDSGALRARFYRTDDAAGAAVFTDMTTPQNIGYCTGQCWYDNFVVSPAGNPDIVYLGGSFSYGQVQGPSNGRAVLLSTDGGSTWSDVTIDKGNDGWIHPDQHALVTIPGSPLQFVNGNDGGVVQSNGKFFDASANCDTRGMDAASTAYCKSLLWRIPDQTYVMNKGLSTLQFQSFSVNPKNSNNLMGGTQDNGTFEYSGSSDVWPQIIYGDGGQSGWNAANSNLRFNTFTGQANDVNFRNGDPAYWVVATGPIFSSPEGAQFYPPIIADPTPANAGSIFQGSFSVWRTQDWGGNQAILEANCPEFTTFAGELSCGDFQRIGAPTLTDLTQPNAVAPTSNYGPTRAGGTVGAIERATTNGGTMWVATSTGRVFISDNANAPAASVAYTRLDTSALNDPNRFVSSIAIDPANPNHAWISYSGYNINTPTLPGHVFEVTRVGGVATWVDRTYDLADLPVTDLVFDDVTGDLYASTDFGVWKLANGAISWIVAAPGMPMVETPGLTMVPSARVLYAATHGRGGWRLTLP